ncbi:MAG: protein-disulfide reductase DsbD family protein [Isosphaeraceae bacterium]
MRQTHRGRSIVAAFVAALSLLTVTASLRAPSAWARADDPKPKASDSNPRAKPKSAKLTTSIEPAAAAPGDTVTLKVKAELNPTYHIYQYTKTPTTGSDSPIYTSFDLFDTGGLEVVGEWTASEDPIKHADTNFPNVPFVEYFEEEVTWSVKLKVPADSAPGEKTIRVQARYMICNDSTCSPPGRWTLPTAKVTIGAGGKTSASAAPAAATQVAEKPAAPIVAATKESPASAAGPTPVAPTPPAETSALPSRVASSSRSAAESYGGSSALPSSSSSSEGTKSEIERKAEEGILPFLLASIIGGLFALVMPCVWPMVPITVNFFVKQGQGKGGQGKATELAVIYSLSIIGVFTAVGVLFSFFVSASALQTLANKAWLNIFVAAMFLLFGLSLLGLFEIRLPSFLLNASSRGESRGGLVGVIFMALTLTITSFTCTFPVVGGLLVMASNGNFLYPIIGLATFATVLALPFLVLALAPTLISKMPRSGDWMNTVKVVGGLIEIGAALKFINTAELAYKTPDNAWINAPVMLTSWIALSAVCALYLLGVFRTDHDHDDVKIGPGRLVFGAAFLGLALHLTPALFGHAPDSKIWEKLVGLLPPDAMRLRAPEVVAGAGGQAMEVKATSSDPARAEREQKSFHGVVWGMSLDQAREQAAAEGKPILIDFTGVNCSNCRNMEAAVFPKNEVVQLLKRFVTIQLYTDYPPLDSLTADQREALGRRNQNLELDLVSEVTNPFYVVLSPSGKVLGGIGGYNEPRVFVDFLNKSLSKVEGEGGTKVAQTEAPAGNGGKASSSE